MNACQHSDTVWELMIVHAPIDRQQQISAAPRTGASKSPLANGQSIATCLEYSRGIWMCLSPVVWTDEDGGGCAVHFSLDPAIISQLPLDLEILLCWPSRSGKIRHRPYILVYLTVLDQIPAWGRTIKCACLCVEMLQWCWSMLLGARSIHVLWPRIPRPDQTSQTRIASVLCCSWTCSTSVST
jgi:hypothetical protein